MVWGFAFVAQRSAMNDMSPLLFNAIRFSMGGTVLALLFRKRFYVLAKQGGLKTHFRCATILGLFLCSAAACQQLAMVTAEAGKAGFVTSLYLVFIPLVLFVFYREKTSSSLLAILHFL